MTYKTEMGTTYELTDDRQQLFVLAASGKRWFEINHPQIKTRVVRVIDRALAKHSLNPMPS